MSIWPLPDDLERVTRRMKIAEKLARQRCEKAGLESEALDYTSPKFFGEGFNPMWRNYRFQPMPHEIDAAERRSE